MRLFENIGFDEMDDFREAMYAFRMRPLFVSIEGKDQYQIAIFNKTDVPRTFLFIKAIIGVIGEETVALPQNKLMELLVMAIEREKNIKLMKSSPSYPLDIIREDGDMTLTIAVPSPKSIHARISAHGKHAFLFSKQTRLDSDVPEKGGTILINEEERLFYNSRGLEHRSEGPSRIGMDQSERWCRDGVLFNPDGPSVINMKRGSNCYAESILQWTNESGQRDRRNGPAEIFSDGTEHYMKDGHFHREGGYPAVIESDGTRKWYRNGLLHNPSGPAILHPSGAEEYWQDGKRHRIDGPACHDLKGNPEYWISGKKFENGLPKKTMAKKTLSPECF